MTRYEFSRWRDAAGWTIRHTAEFLDVDPRTVRRWEAGRSPVPRMALLCLETFGAGHLPTDDPAWRDWRMANGYLLPAGWDRPLRPGDIYELQFLHQQLAEARRQLRMPLQPGPCDIPADLPHITAVQLKRLGG